MAAEETNPILDHYLNESVGKNKGNVIFPRQHKNFIREWQKSHFRMPWLSKRLPGTIVPHVYDLKFFIDLEKDFYLGEATIDVEALEDFQEILIHSNQLTITSTGVSCAKTGKSMDIEEKFQYWPSRYYVMKFRKIHPAGLYVIRLEFTRQYMQIPEGIIKVSYGENSTKHIVYTKLMSVFARRVFPCFDEPQLKAKFRLTVVHNPDATALSNMPEENRVMRSDGFLETSFPLSMTMTTNLFAVIVCDFNYSETNLVSGQRLRYFAEPNTVNYTAEAIKIIPKALHMIEELFNDTFTYPKLDFIVVPKILSGGMENWGLVLLKSVKLVTPEMSPIDVFWAEKTIVHELAHHWFGNLVTMSWWSEIWLNEAFSNYVAFKLMRQLSPLTELITVDSKFGMLMSHSTDRPVISAVEEPQEIRNMFDKVTYVKGFAIVEMLADCFPEAFDLGLSNYLKKYSYKNINTGDLWTELSKVLPMDFNVTESMHSWLHEPHYPLVKIVRNGTFFTATQEPFISKHAHVKLSNRILWHIPLTYKNLDTEEVTLHWLREKEAIFPLNAESEHAVKFNPNFKGFYLIQYERDDYTRLINRLHSNVQAISELDRLHLLSELITSVRNNYVTYDVLLDYTTYLVNETSFFIWKTFEKYVFSELIAIRHPEATDLTLMYLNYLTENAYNFTRDNATMKDFALVMDNIACRVGNKLCMESNSEKFQLWLQNKTVKSSELRSFFRYVKDNNHLETIWSEFTSNSTNSERRMDLAKALILNDNKTVLERTLQYILDSEKISADHASELCLSIIHHPDGVDVLIDSLETEWGLYEDKLPGERSANLVKQILQEVESYKEINKVKRISRCHQDVIPLKWLSLYVEVAENNVRRRETTQKYIIEWMLRTVPLLQKDFLEGNEIEPN